MSTLFTILAFLVIFSLLILIHEAGHFFAAKKSGVKVEEFGMGLPPRIWGFKKGETLYSINWIPFGGFVRTLGEGDDSKEAKTSKRSFQNQSLRVQAFIVCAGVLMNFLLSFVLLTVGFWIGIEPLIASQEDFEENIRAGYVDVEPGLLVLESTSSVLSVGDRLLGFESVEEWEETVAALEEETGSPLITVVDAQKNVETLYLTKDVLNQITVQPFYLSGVIYQANAMSVFDGVLQQGDVLVSVRNAKGEQTFLLTTDDFDQSLKTLHSPVLLTVYRPTEGTFELQLDLPVEHPVISFVESASPADEAGLEVGDRVLSVGGETVTQASQVVECTQLYKQILSENPVQETIVFEVLKKENTESEFLTLSLRPEDGRVGVGLADVVPSLGMTSVYQAYVPYSLIELKDIQLGASAPVYAVSEMWRLGKMTAVTFVGVLKQFVMAEGVPEGVSGPVGIAQMTGVTIQDGFAATLRFVAMLSLSLGVINILPFPALDGGHFAGILFKAVTGRRGLAKWANLVNMAGFVFLLLFIAYVTFNDILNLL